VASSRTQDSCRPPSRRLQSTGGLAKYGLPKRRRKGGRLFSLAARNAERAPQSEGGGSVRDKEERCPERRPRRCVVLSLRAARALPEAEARAPGPCSRSRATRMARATACAAAVGERHVRCGVETEQQRDVTPTSGRLVRGPLWGPVQRRRQDAAPALQGRCSGLEQPQIHEHWQHLGGGVPARQGTQGAAELLLFTRLRGPPCARTARARRCNPVRRLATERRWALGCAPLQGERCVGRSSSRALRPYGPRCLPRQGCHKAGTQQRQHPPFAASSPPQVRCRGRAAATAAGRPEPRATGGAEPRRAAA